MPFPGEVQDLSGLATGRVNIPVGDLSLKAYFARPRQADVRSAVVVLHEAFGLGEHIEDVVRRLANVGYYAIAPDLYSHGAVPDLDDMTSVFAVMFGLPDAAVVRDVEAVIEYAKGELGSEATVACLGFCSGGRQALLVACSGSGMSAVVNCWGGFITRATVDEETTPQRPTRIIDMAPSLSCPALVVGGRDDANPSPEVLGELSERLVSQGMEVTLRIFDDAGHAFFADYRPTYREAAAHALWSELVPFLDEHLRSARRHTRT